LPAVVAFSGFPRDAIDFYEQLEADNSRPFWQANKSRFEASVKQPMLALCEQLADFGPFHLFRPYNDVRFAKDRPPYKTAQGAVGELDGGSTYYVQISATGLMVGAGMYAMAADQLDRFRQAAADDARGSELASIVASAAERGYETVAIGELKTAPRGYPKDHPRIELIRRKGLVGVRSWPVVAWLHTAKVADRVRGAWDELAPLCTWLDAHVGPSTLAPPDFGR
jgi:uncharacterized protein (TIGR02453 family)